jgi:hypothetical protein
MADLGQLYTAKELKALGPKKRAALHKRAVQLVRSHPEIRKIVKKHPKIRKTLKTQLRGLYSRLTK